MRLPSENVLDVAHCLDFASFLALQRSGSAFYGVVHRNLPILPRLRLFDFYLYLAEGVHTLHEVAGNSDGPVSSLMVPFDDEFDNSTLQPLAAIIGTNFVNSAVIANTRDPMEAMKFDMRKAVEALPALKHVRELTFECRCLMHTNYDVDIATLKELILSPLNNLQCLKMFEVQIGTDWAFLRNEWALRLRSVFVEADYYFGNFDYEVVDATGQAEILKYCTDFAHLDKGKSKKLTITGWLISSEFLQRIVTTVSESKDLLTVVVDGAPGFVGNDADYARAEILPEDSQFDWQAAFVRYSARVGSHRVFVRTERPRTIAVTNNPFVTTWSDIDKWGIEGF